VLVGAAPLVALPVIALAGFRNVASGTLERREVIEKKIIAANVKKVKKNTEVDTASLFKAVGFLGAAGVAVATVAFAPFSGLIESAETSAPAAKTANPEVTKVAPKSNVVGTVKASKAPKGYDMDVSEPKAAKPKAAKPGKYSLHQLRLYQRLFVLPYFSPHMLSRAFCTTLSTRR